MEKQDLANLAMRILEEALYFQEEGPMKGMERFTDKDIQFCMNWASIAPERVKEYKQERIKYLCRNKKP